MVIKKKAVSSNSWRKDEIFSLFMLFSAFPIAYFVTPWLYDILSPNDERSVDLGYFLLGVLSWSLITMLASFLGMKIISTTENFRRIAISATCKTFLFMSAMFLALMATLLTWGYVIAEDPPKIPVLRKLHKAKAEVPTPNN
jgi:O-antigen/teichoic acid export membrane protein